MYGPPAAQSIAYALYAPYALYALLDAPLTGPADLRSMNITHKLALLLSLASSACMPVAAGALYETVRPERVAVPDMTPLRLVRFESRIKLRVGDSVFVGEFIRLDSLGLVMGGRHEPMRRIPEADIDSVWLSRDNVAYIMAGISAGALLGGAAGASMARRETDVNAWSRAVSMGTVMGAIVGGAVASNIDDWELLCYRGPAPAQVSPAIIAAERERP